MTALMAWCVPAEAFWSWRNRLHVWYERHWITVEPRERMRYMAIYGVLYR